MASPYEVLGVDADAGEDAVVAAYRERVKQTHPDQGGSVAAFQRVRAAYQAIDAGETDQWLDPEDPGEWAGADGSADAHTWADASPTGERAGPDSEGRRHNVAERPPPEPSRVEYLDYAVLEDFGLSLDAEDLFERAADADLPESAHGEFVVQPDESLLEAAEANGFTWPYACRGGACANCSVAVCDGKLAQPVDTILDSDLADRGFRLSCNGIPLTDRLQVVYNVKHLPGLDELRLPPGPFELAHAGD